MPLDPAVNPASSTEQGGGLPSPVMHPSVSGGGGGEVESPLSGLGDAMSATLPPPSAGGGEGNAPSQHLNKTQFKDFAPAEGGGEAAGDAAAAGGEAAELLPLLALA
jgi:hypothetical protein